MQKSLKHIQDMDYSSTRQSPENRDLEDYDVYGQNGEFLGSVELPEESNWQDMPTELEINGFVYRREDIKQGS